jgi:hypothetical protein
LKIRRSLRHKLAAEQQPQRLGPDGKAYKDGGLAIVLNRDAPARVPCEAAWKVPAYRARVYAWLGEGDSPARIVMWVQMPLPLQELRDAVFVREMRVYHGQTMIVAVDPLTGTIFAARRP